MDDYDRQFSQSGQQWRRKFKVEVKLVNGMSRYNNKCYAT
jgi:hypothetical protein